MINHRIFSFCFLIFLLVSILTNYAILTTKDYEPDYIYITNILIVSVYVLSIILDLSLFILVLNSLFIKPRKNQSKITSINISLLIILVWVELIYSSVWYYGLGNHQNAMIASNWGIIGSIIFISYLIFTSEKKNKTKMIWFSCVFLMHILIFLILSPVNILKL